MVPGSVQSKSMIPYQAYYTLELSDMPDGVQPIVGIRGVVKVNHEQTCQGWTIFEMLRMEVTARSGAVFVQKLQFSGLESLDGKKLRFTANGKGPSADVNTLGRATIRTTGGEARFRRPHGTNVSLPENTRFPIHLTNWIVEQAESGVTHIKSYAFDGTDPTGPELFSIIVKNRVHYRPSATLASGSGLVRPGWNIRLTAFSSANGKLTPEYAYDAIILENGVLVDAELDFSEFRVRQTLRSFKTLPVPNCPEQK